MKTSISKIIKILAVLIAVIALPYKMAYPACVASLGATYTFTPASSGDSCTSGLLLSWHAENVDVTLGTPAGCSAGATTAALTSGCAITASQYNDGTHSLEMANGTCHAQFSVANNDILTSAAGTMTFYFRYHTWAVGNMVSLLWWGTDVDRIEIKMNTTTGQLLERWVHGGSVEAAAYSGITMSVDTWYLVTVHWSVASHGGNYIGVKIGANTEDFGTDVITAPTSTTTGLVDFGDDGWSGTAQDLFIDQVQIKNSWL